MKRVLSLLFMGLLLIGGLSFTTCESEDEDNSSSLILLFGGLTGGDGDEDEVDGSVIIATSTPSNGQTNSSISYTVSIIFNKNMKGSSFENNITVRNSSSSDYICLYSYDPNIHELKVYIPYQLLTPEWVLESNETYTITISKKVKTAEGSSLENDLSISFTTFEYGLIYDDSSEMSEETHGIDYHSASDSLFYIGYSSWSAADYKVRRLDLSTMSATTVVDNASTQVCYGGLSIWDDLLYVSESYDREVTVYNNLSDLTLLEINVYSSPTLPSPNDDLIEVLDTVKINDILYFTSGNYLTSTSFQDILSYNITTDTWSIAVSSNTHGFDGDDDKNLDAVNITGVDYLILADSASKKLFKFKTDGSLVKSIDLGDNWSWSMDVRHDDVCNIYIGTSRGIFKYNGDLELIDKKEGLNAARIAIKNSVGTTEVFYINYRSTAKIYHTFFDD